MGLLFVCVTLVAAVHIPDPDLGSQIVTAVFGGALVISYLVKENWKAVRHRALFVFCAVVLLIHFGAYAVAYGIAGRTKAVLAGPAIIVEIVFFSYVFDRLMRKEPTSQQ